jgi:hypothetical protein
MIKYEGAIPRGVWFVIATRSSKKDGAGWRLHDDAVMSIDAAKEAHDGGLLDMAQGRDQETFYLKVMFRTKPDTKRKPWFFRTESEHDKAMKRAVNYVRGTRAKRKEVAA